jgi:hypothetical protein
VKKWIGRATYWISVSKRQTSPEKCLCHQDGKTFPVVAARKAPHTQETQHERDPCVQAVVDAELEEVCPELIVSDRQQSDCCCRSQYQVYVVDVSQADEYYDDKACMWFEVVVLRDLENRLSFPRLTL